MVVAPARTFVVSHFHVVPPVRVTAVIELIFDREVITFVGYFDAEDYLVAILRVAWFVSSVPPSGDSNDVFEYWWADAGTPG